MIPMKTKKTLAAFVAAVLLLLSCALHVSAETAPSVSVRIEGIENTMFTGDVPLGESKTVVDVLKTLDEQNDTVTLELVDSAYGPYLSGVNDDKEGHFGATMEGVYDGWLFMVNGVPAAAGMSVTELTAGDSLVVYFGDSMVLGMQIPVMNTEKLEEGVLTFTSEDTVYDANWNATVETNPVVGMTVEWTAGDKTFTGETDENGSVTIPKEYRTAGEHTVRVSRYHESGCPTVLRGEETVTLDKGAESFPILPVAAAVAVVLVVGCAVLFVVKKKHAA